MPFKDGNIISLTLINFQTFKNTTINFSPSLNFILGPNGSGKSTISNALSFIFGGNPKTIGKAKHLKDYIRFGEDKCKIEAKISFNNSIVILTRSMSHTSNSYYIDKESVKKNDYDAFVSRLRININNLCQYLPQERVSEFVRMTPEELLIQTCLSLQKNTLVDDLQATRDTEQRLSEVSNKENVMTTEKTNIKNVVDNIYKDVEKIKEKESKMQRIEMMEKKKIWVDYESMKGDYKRLTNNLKILRKSLKENNKEYEKITEEIEVIKKSPLNIQMMEKIKELDKWDNQIKDKISRIKQKKSDKAYLEVDLEHLTRRREKNREESKNLANEIGDLEDTLEKIKEEIKKKLTSEDIFKVKEQAGCKKKKMNDIQFGDEVEIDKFIVEFDTREMNELESRLFELKRKKNEILDLCAEKKNKFDLLEEKKKKINEEGERRLELLKRYHLDTYTAVVWYRENKALFKEEIIEPSFLNINITNERYTAEVETFLSFVLMTSFICKDSRDFEKFMRLMKDEKRLRINAVEEIRRVEKCEYSPSQIKAFGFDGVLLDFVDARKETKDFLVAHGHFDSIPITKKSINEKEIFQKTSIKRFAMNSKYCEIKRSRYHDQDFVVMTSEITQRNVFSKKIDTSEIESQLEEISKDRERHNVELKAVYQEIDKVQGSFKEILHRKNNHDKSVGDVRTRVNLYNMNLNTLKQKKEILEGLRNSRELDLKEKEINLKIERIQQEMIEIKNSMINTLRDDEYILTVRDCMMIYKDISSEFKKLDFLQSNSTLLEKSIKEINGQIEENEKVKSKLKIKIEESAKRLQETDTSLSHLGEQMRLLPDTVEELNSEIQKEKTQLKFLNVNEEAKVEYENKKSQLDRISEDLSNILKNKKKYEERVKSKRIFLIKEIGILVEKINKEFQDLFSQIGCEGKLEFYHKGGEAPCKSWKLNILVKFREKEKLEVLSSFRQSGGEKSVSTILFLLALQRIDTAPFRLVDEINQGMDKHNEKSILDILFNMASSTQFFIISPKLVEGLAYNENMKIIILFSDQPGAVKKAFAK